MIDFKESLAFVDFPENLDDNQLRAKILELNFNLSTIKNTLENMDRLNISEGFGYELDSIIRRISYLYVLTDACDNYVIIDDTEGAYRLARLAALYACDDFYHSNDKTLSTINKYLERQ